MMRKYFMNMTKKELKNIPFYCWQCVTLTFKHREVDIVIKDEEQLSYFLRFLIQQLYTVDGRRDSARPLINAMVA